MSIQLISLTILSSSPYKVNNKNVEIITGRDYVYLLDENVSYYKIEAGREPCAVFSFTTKRFEILVKSNSSSWIKLKTVPKENKFYIEIIDCAHQLLELEMNYGE